MKLTFLGAAHEVTGSRFLLTACGKNILIDYGMEQGENLFENAPLPIAAGMVDYVFLTHAHIDHSGWLPLLVKQGFKGRIYATAATADLCGIMLLDSAHIQEMDAEWKNRKAQRSGKPDVEPLYDTEDAQAACALFSPCEYNREFEVCPGLRAKMVDVGHLLGSASIALTVTEEGQTLKLAFSGDIGNLHQPLLRDPSYLDAADYVVMESTYGDRSHGERPDYLRSLTEVLQSTFDRGGSVVIPSFAVGRTQELLYFIRQIKEEGRVKGHDGFTVYVDSPLAIEATHVFTENTLECCDEEALALVRAGINPIDFPGLKLAVSSDESKLINEDQEPKVIISASGMCDAGRIRHHLKHNLWRAESTVLFVGYQSVGTLGRSLVDGADEVKLFGEPIAVRARIGQLAGISGHADNNGLMTWARHIQGNVRRAFVVHGDDKVVDVFAGRLRDELGWQATAPYPGESWDLLTGERLCEGDSRRIEKKQPERAEAAPKAAEPRLAPKAQRMPQPEGDIGPAYGELLAAVQRLTELADRMRGAGRKEQQKLANQLSVLVKKFNR